MKNIFKRGIAVILVLLMVVMMVPTSASAAVKISKSKVTIEVGNTTTLKITGTSKTVKWTTSNKKIATVSSKGKIKGISEGTATITATVSSKQYKCKVTVIDKDVDIVLTALIFDNTSIDDYIKNLKEEKPEYKYKKYDDKHFTVTIKKSEWKEILGLTDEWVKTGFEDIMKNSDFNNAFTDIKYDKLLEEVIFYVDKVKYSDFYAFSLYFQIAFMSDYVQAVNLADIDDRGFNLTILDNSTNKVLYQKK